MSLHVHPNCLHMATRSDGTPWWTAFPSPKSTPRSISDQEVFRLLEDALGDHNNSAEKQQHQTKDFLLVDVRRTDFNGGTISTAINVPAHGFYVTRGGLYALCRQAGMKRVVFYCGQSNGRGPRCAAWMQDYIDEVGGADEMEALVLTGGIKGWVKEYGGKMIDGYEEEAWKEEEK
ncbi:Rhodanese-like domain-containing protein [Immersiella caudata]|uniref:Rhodanese-like domain-containing protein n=1 Tax=Immersiella caudata TaxID=314043 RepID=A0AA40CBI3_9PEZI|nr:Rhodanese-like domain-containing protein [Immersiella caudata]